MIRRTLSTIVCTLLVGVGMAWGQADYYRVVLLNGPPAFGKVSEMNRDKIVLDTTPQKVIPIK